MRGALPPLPNTPSWRGAQLSTGTALPLPFTFAILGSIQKFPDWPSAPRYSCIAILSVSLMNFAAITLCVASQLVFIFVSVYFFIDSIRKVSDSLSHTGEQ
jgi:hypothetical protein